MQKRTAPAIIVISCLLLVTFFLSLNLGKVQVNFIDMLNIFMNKLGLSSGFSSELTQQKMIVFFNVRLPRSIVAMLVGAALSSAGAVMQCLYHNPLAAPDVLGVSQAANFGVGFAIFFFSGGTLMVQSTSFFFGIGVMVFTFLLVARLGGTSITTLVLVGVIISSLFQAGLTLLMFISDPYGQMLRISYWIMGAFNTVSWIDVKIVLPVVSLGLLFLCVFSWQLNLLAQGDEEAQTLGMNIKVWRIAYIFFVALIVSVSTASVGNVAWVGLIIPHITRFLVGSNQRLLIPCSALTGALFLLVIDTLVRNLTWGEIPVSIVTSFVAAPFLLWFIIRNKQGFTG